ncbi:MAG: hypothetical protein ACRCTD_12100 [Beijerinckiaceae bacterium]
MMTNDTNRLRTILKLDAATCFSSGLLLTLGATLLSPWLGLPAAFLFYAGLVLMPAGLFILWTALRPVLPQWALLVIIVGNVLWSVESLLLLAMPHMAPRTTLGAVGVVMQAFMVAGFALFEWRGYRTMRQSPALG